MEKFFLNKMLYYNKNDKSIRTNNILENYNSQIHRILNGKKLLSWTDYKNFLIEEEYRFKEKLSNLKNINNSKVNITLDNKDKETGKYNENNNNLQENKKIYWFKWYSNSCRFDCFTLMIYIIYYKYLIINSRNSVNISKLTDLINDLKKLSNFEFKT